MRLNGDISFRSEEEEKERGGALQQQKKLVVGYALTSKKVKSFLQPKLEGLARKKGILFVAIDQNKPLSDQGPFDIVLHKLSGKEWHQILEAYREQHPEVTVLDPPDAIQHLYNRQSMLQDVADMNLTDCHDLVPYRDPTVIPSDPFDPSPLLESDPTLECPLAAPLLVQREQIDDILDEQVVTGREGDCQRYLVRWKGRPSSEDSWITRAELQRLDPDLLEKYQSTRNPYSTRSSSSQSGRIGEDTRARARFDPACVYRRHQHLGAAETSLWLGDENGLY